MLGLEIGAVDRDLLDKNGTDSEILKFKLIY